MKIVSLIGWEDRKAIEEICKARGEIISDFIRRAIRREIARYKGFPPEVMKYLEMDKKEEEGGESDE